LVGTHRHPVSESANVDNGALNTSPDISSPGPGVPCRQQTTGAFQLARVIKKFGGGSNNRLPFKGDTTTDETRVEIGRRLNLASSPPSLTCFVVALIYVVVGILAVRARAFNVSSGVSAGFAQDAVFRPLRLLRWHYLAPAGRGSVRLSSIRAGYSRIGWRSFLAKIYRATGSDRRDGLPPLRAPSRQPLLRWPLFACRLCYGLSYASQHQAALHRGLEQARKRNE
jgi:hypothetical protein